MGRKQHVPVRCKLCTSMNQPLGKVLDAVSTKPKDVTWFLKQHMNTMIHMDRVRRLHLQNTATPPTNQPERLVACQGLVIAESGQEAPTRLHAVAHHVQEWMSWQSFDHGLHKRSYSVSNEATSCSITIRHGECLKDIPFVEGNLPVCPKCDSLTGNCSIRRVLQKFVTKKFAAERLHAMLYLPDGSVEELETSMKADAIYQQFPTPFDKIIQKTVVQLKEWVSSSYVSQPMNRRSQVLCHFIQKIVGPCLAVNVHAALNAKPQLLRVQSLFEIALTSGMASDMDKLNVEIAKSSIEGKLSKHPMLQGLIVSCLKQVERFEQGKSMVGRAGETSIMFNPAACALAHEAGCALAILGGNGEMLARLGQSSRIIKRSLKDMDGSGLPTPMLALSDPAVISRNMALIDQRLSTTTGKTGCGLAWPSCIIFFHL